MLHGAQESVAPKFDDSSFKPDPNGWINTIMPNCSISVSDTVSGLDIDSAQFQLKYLTGTTNKTGSFTVLSSDKNGVKTTTLSAVIQDLNLNISEVKSIQFSIKDLAGNQAFSIIKNFKMDTVKPSSQINNIGSFLSGYKSPFTISASASDDKSGVKSVALFYKFSGDWVLFSEIKNPYQWLFPNVGSNYPSGYYEVTTIATDNASNKEDFPINTEGKILSFAYDTVAPHISNVPGKEYFNKLPTFSIDFEDDFKLEKVEYKLNFSTNWTLIKNNINSDSYTGEWSISQDAWDHMVEKVEYLLLFKLTDFCGNQYVTNNSEATTIIKDFTTTRSYLDLSDFKNLHFDNIFSVSTNLNGEQNIKRMALYYRYSSDKETWTQWQQYGKNLSKLPFEWNFTASEGSGFYEFYTWALDSSGVVGQSDPESVNVTLFPTTPIIIMILLAIILFISTTFILVKMKKKKS